jgi:hypothetical protein
MSSDETAAPTGRGRRAHRRRSSRRAVGPRSARLPYPLAAAAVGLLVAVLTQVLVFGGGQACEVVRGTSSCGSAGGGFMLLAIGVLMVLAGARLLRTLAVPEPVITSVLGVALLTILVLAVLIDVIFSVWMWVVLPVLAAVAFAFSAWAATRLSAAGSG